MHGLQLLLPLPLLSRQVLPIKLLHARGPEARILVTHPRWWSLPACCRIIEVKLTAGLEVEVLQAEVLAPLLHLPPCSHLVGLNHCQQLVGAQQLPLAGPSLRPLLLAALLVLRLLRLQGLQVDADRAALRVEDPVAAVELDLPAPGNLPRQPLLVRKPGLGSGTQDVSVEAGAFQEVLRHCRIPGLLHRASGIHVPKILRRLHRTSGLHRTNGESWHAISWQ
mmetsp:Transcript_103306/g.287562  ORF Transcript_103306/g.287562 Transcript_103306/m.287562 type:complete len:223 (+) Transcript_103306:807-1475(+)